MTSFFVRAAHVTALAAAVGALASGALAQGPAKRPVPASAVAPADSAPVLMQRKPASAPPSSVAPRMRAQTQTVRAAQADSAVRPMPAASAPVESVRPAQPAPTAIEPPPARKPPARPAATMRAEPVPAASLISDSPPANATGRCKDGTWLTSTIVESTSCASNGGLASRFPVKSVPPKRP